MNDDLKKMNLTQIFVRDAMPSSWLDYADELIDAAEHLWSLAEEGFRFEVNDTVEGNKEIKKIISISRPYILFASFAIENMIKGLIVAQNPTHINNGKLSKELKSHKLLKLLKLINDLELSKDEIEICKILEDAIPYWGRYPIPLNYNDILPEIGITQSKREIILGLHIKLGKKLYARIKNGWDSKVGPKLINIDYKKYA